MAAPATETVVWPSSTAVIVYVQSRHPRLGRIAEMGHALPLEPKAFAALVALLRSCREKEGSSAVQEADTEMLPDAETFPLSYTGVLPDVACHMAAPCECAIL